MCMRMIVSNFITEILNKEAAHDKEESRAAHGKEESRDTSLEQGE